MRIRGPETVPVVLTALFLMGAIVVANRLMMPHLMHRAAAAGVRFERRLFTEHADIEALPARYRVIANCSGLGARHLFKDEAVSPIKGQLVDVCAVPLPYTVIHGPYYAFPRGDNCVLGDVPLLAWLTHGSGTGGALLAPARYTVSPVARTRRSAPRSWSAA
jgi:hypothetical protein